MALSWLAVFGWRLGLIDQPSARSSHLRPTPKGGGVGMAAAFLLTAVVLDMPIAFWLPLGLLAGLSFRGDQVEHLTYAAVACAIYFNGDSDRWDMRRAFIKIFRGF